MNAIDQKSCDLETYYEQNLGQVWSTDEYDRYKDVLWDWRFFPFADNPGKREKSFKPPLKQIAGRSILEIGSAMGQGYAFLKSSGCVDLSRYTGMEVSDKGYRRSCERFPEAHWIHADFTKYVLKETFDYVYERHAIHHMPNPLAQYEKIAHSTHRAIQTVFRGRLFGRTVSDLNVGRFVTPAGIYYLNVINLCDVISIGLEAGFNHVQVLYGGDHEPISSDPNAEMYLNRVVQHGGGSIMRFILRMAKCPQLKRPWIYGFTNVWKFYFSRNFYRLQTILAGMSLAT